MRYNLGESKKHTHIIIFQVDCIWSTWSDWTSCSKTCGQGSKNRRREVQTRAQNGGSQCQGLSRQNQSCNVRDCPSPGRLKNMY